VWTRLDEVPLPVKKNGTAMVEELLTDVTALRPSASRVLAAATYE
jgi:hypothetical protein